MVEEIDENLMQQTKKDDVKAMIIVIVFTIILFIFTFGREVYKRQNAMPLNPLEHISIGDVYRVEKYTFEDKPIYFTNDIESPLIHRIYLPVSVEIDGNKWYTYGVLAEYDGQLVQYVDYGTGLLQSRFTSDREEIVEATMKSAEAQNSLYKYKLVEVVESENAKYAFQKWCNEHNIDKNYIIACGLK